MTPGGASIVSVFSTTANTVLPRPTRPVPPAWNQAFDRVDGTAREGAFLLAESRENPSLRAATLLDRARRFCHFRALVLRSGSRRNRIVAWLVKRNNSWERKEGRKKGSSFCTRFLIVKW